MRALPPIKGNYHLQDYHHTYDSFQWKDSHAHFSWHKTGRINIAYEAIDRHAETDRKNKIALYYTDRETYEEYTFKEMKEWTNKAGNILKNVANVKKGDRVFIFLPRSPQLYFALLGTIKLGAIAGPLFEAFMSGPVKDRLTDSEAKVLITTPELLKRVPVDSLPNLKHIFLVGEGIEENDKLIDFNTHLNEADKHLEIEWVDQTDGMVLHYTSRSIGSPKGILLPHQAMIQYYETARWVLDLHEGDVYWCTADPGWVTGTAYGVFGPWLNGTSNVVVGDRFSPSNWYEVLQNYKVSVWYSAPAAFRMLMGAGDELIDQYDLSSLRHIVSVGEPLNPEVIEWGMKVFQKRIHDTWWMTETGGMMIANYPSMEIKPGSMGKPIPGIEVAIIDDQGQVLMANKMGNLAIKKDWPAMMRLIWNQNKKYDSYFINDWFVSGDSAYIDEDGYLWFQGRVDEVIISAGERVGPFEVESKLVDHPAIAEAGVIGRPDPVHGEVIKAYIVLQGGFEPSEKLKEDIRQFIKKEIAVHASPNEIEFKDKLPKTRSGKIMRRVLTEWDLNSQTSD